MKRSKATSQSDEAHSVGGWRIFAHPLLLDQLDRLVTAVEKERAKKPESFRSSANWKLLAALSMLLFETIPQDPARPEYRQGNALGPHRRHWFRARFGGGRFRLFFRYSAKAKIIVYAWVNDETTLRTYGSRSDAYAVFAAMLRGGSPPDDWEALLTAAGQEAAAKRLRTAKARHGKAGN